MTKLILLIGNYKDRLHHKDFIKSCYPLRPTLESYGMDFTKYYVKPDPDSEVGENLRFGLLVEPQDTSMKKQLQKLLTDNGLSYILEPSQGWVEMPLSNLVPVPHWGKVKQLVDKVFGQYRYSDDPALVIFVFRLEQAAKEENLLEFYKAMEAVLKKVTLSEEGMKELKEKLFLYNVYCLEL